MAEPPVVVDTEDEARWEFTPVEAPHLRVHTPMPTPDELEAVREVEKEHYRAAVQARREFVALVRGSRARAALTSREDLPTLGFAVAEIMLAEVLTGRWQPRSAKEALEAAKLALEIARRETGEPDKRLEITTPEQRQKAIDTLQQLAAAVQARAMPAPQPEVLDVVASAPARAVLGTLAAPTDE